MNPLIKLAILFTCLLLSACATVGKDFDHALVATVKNGKTTKAEVLGLFGKPFKTGLQNGSEIWIYETNTYTVSGNDSSKNFTIVFDKSGVVQTHQMMSSMPGN